MADKIRVVIADDERPARSFLTAMLRDFEDVEIVGEAQTGAEAVELIEGEKPDLALLDLQMPELDGLGVVRLLRKNATPLVAFVTAYEEYAVSAFELNAVDYLLKPVERARLRETINRAQERLERADLREGALTGLRAAVADFDKLSPPRYLERIPVRARNEIRIIPTARIASIVADGELLHLSTLENEVHIISYRLKDLEARLDPARFIRLGRGTLVNINEISRIVQMPGGAYAVHLSNNQELSVSRLQSRILRRVLLRL
ncbi:MAG TPA: LytTR family DNA-binding domain-containing protein [Blastocatellia bacterium]